MAENAQYVTLGIAGETFAAPVGRVQEILEVQPISRIPNAPASFLGMIDVRGQGVPVIDLRMKLGLEAASDTVNTRILVLRVHMDGRELILGLKADRVFEVTALDNTVLEQPPQIGVRWSSELITGVGRRNGAFVTVLDLERLFGSADLAMALQPAAA